MFELESLSSEYVKKRNRGGDVLSAYAIKGFNHENDESSVSD